MPSSVGRNEPCPCGSGLKFKRCCLGKAPAERRKRIAALPIALLALAVAGGVYGGIAGGAGLGFSIAAAGLVLAVLVYVFRDPPPPRGGQGGDAAAINFGGR